jgi:hypothetical protein
MSIKELWRGRKFYTSPYPLIGPRTSGLANVPVDLLKNIQEDTIDTLSVRLVGNIVVAGSAAGTGVASGFYNPQQLVTLSTLNTAPQAAGLIPVNALSGRGVVVDHAAQVGAFETFPPIPDIPGTYPIDSWIHFTFKRDWVRKGIEFAHPLKKWKTDLLTVVLGTRDQLYTGGTNTWDMTAVTVEFWADMDVASDPENIHAIEIFEQPFNITASNPSFIINTLPAGTFYDTLMFITEDANNLTDGILLNIDIEGAGRFWLPQGENNAVYVRQRYTRLNFFDPNVDLTGIYILPLRDGLWSRAMDAVSQPIVIKLNVVSLSATSLVRLVGRKIVPGAIKKTTRTPQGGKQVVALPDAGGSAAA